MKKETDKDVMRRWGIPEERLKSMRRKNLRYANPIEKGIYWYFFSLAIRTRDVAKYGSCISCERPITVETCDAGHFIPAGSCGAKLLFDPRNVNAECSHCNAWDDLHLLGYARTLDQRYGDETAEALLARHRANKGTLVKDFTKKQYAALITRLQDKGL